MTLDMAMWFVRLLEKHGIPALNCHAKYRELRDEGESDVELRG